MVEFFLVLLLVSSFPIFDHNNDLVRHWKGVDHAGYFYYSRINVEDLVCDLAIASRTNEYVGECARAHGVGDCWIFDPKVALQCLSKSSSRSRTILRGEYFLDTLAATKRLFSQSTAKDGDLAGEDVVREVGHECLTALFNCADEPLNFHNVFACCSGIDFYHIAGVLNLVKFLIHHDDFDYEAGASV